MKQVRVTTLEELKAVAMDALQSYQPDEGAFVITLTGDLGVGKTAFTKELGKILGVPHEITSPTFVVMKSYAIPEHVQFKTLVHIDAYRIESDDEMRVLGLQNLFKEKNHILCIEWPERIQNLIPKNVYKIAITLHTDGTRDITYGY